MAITSTTNEAKHGNRTTRANESTRTARQAADAGRNSRRDSSRRPTPRATARPASNYEQAAGNRRKGELPVELTIDMDDDRVIEAVARFLLGITRHKHQAKT